jgi:diguanylate cyclase (GGDEF)-like protein/PAS domain S-box-containing protein
MSNEAPIGIALIDSLSGQFYSANLAFANITGRTVEALLHFNWMNITHPDDLPAELRNMALLNTGKLSGFQMEKRFRHRDGSFVWISMTVAPVYVEDNAHPRHLCMIEDITARKQSEEGTRNDALTGIPNRRLLMERLGSAQILSAHNHQFGAVLFLDLDKLKTLNDTPGSDFDDLLLIEAAARIRSCVREENTVARLEGDEFVVLLENVDGNAEEALQKVALSAEKIRAALTLPYHLKGQQQHSSPSIGMMLFQGNEEIADTLLKQAEIAMYQAKGTACNGLHFFDPDMQRAAETRPVLEAYLRHAVSDQQLHLHYQIQVDNDRLPIGAEALVRWIHPTRGMVSPAQFIPIAEESSLILDIGGWVLDNACQQLGVWAESTQTRNLTLAVNVSAQQFKQHNFVEKIADLLRIYNIAASHLTLELTEGVVLGDLTDGLSKMQALKALGVGLSIDNFGVGASSLTYLKQLPLDQIKINRSFVRDIATDPNEAVMVQAIIDMTQNLCLDVIAEGVETEEQLSFLKAQGCAAYQGYFFSKPVPIEQFEELLKYG